MCLLQFAELFSGKFFSLPKSKQTRFDSRNLTQFCLQFEFKKEFLTFWVGLSPETSIQYETQRKLTT